MKLMHASGFSAPEREAFRGFVFSNMVGAMQAILSAMREMDIALTNPENEDILRCRVKSTGITETTFHLGLLTYRMFDVGGQRSERKKWIHCFEGNQMEEALMLFDQVCNSQWFVETSMILFMNKTDIFRNKIQYSPIKEYFRDYTGAEGDMTAATEFFRQRFTQLNRSERKEVYVHNTDATDTNLLRNIMDSVNEIVLARNGKNVLVL
ncbi:hypothetical protein BGZ58_010296 [Dissophora ornata]|nr:hypothetical protein BGZ58_010296 [Dissophora ornata]